MITDDRTFFDSKTEQFRWKYHRVNILLGGKSFTYYDLPAHLAKSPSDYVYSLIFHGQPKEYLFGISSKVKELFRPYWMYHEYRKNLEFQSTMALPGLEALEKELELLSGQEKQVYVPARRNYFRYLVNHSNLENLSAWEIRDQEKCLLRLEELASSLKTVSAEVLGTVPASQTKHFNTLDISV